MPWWKANTDEFPTLLRMVQDILSIALTSISVERVFSSARDVIPHHRNQLSAIMIEKVLIAKCLLREHILEREDQPIDIDDDLVDFANMADNTIGPDILDTEFLQLIVPQDSPCSDDTGDNTTRETDLDTDVSDLEYDGCQLRPPPQTPYKRKAMLVINTLLTGHLHKHVKRNYQV